MQYIFISQGKVTYGVQCGCSYVFSRKHFPRTPSRRTYIFKLDIYYFSTHVRAFNITLINLLCLGINNDYNGIVLNNNEKYIWSYERVLIIIFGPSKFFRIKFNFIYLSGNDI